jgi:hypothetical protein
MKELRITKRFCVFVLLATAVSFSQTIASRNAITEQIIGAAIL